MDHLAKRMMHEHRNATIVSWESFLAGMVFTGIAVAALWCECVRHCLLDRGSTGVDIGQCMTWRVICCWVIRLVQASSNNLVDLPGSL